MAKQVLDPVTRIEGHLRLETETDGLGQVTNAEAMCDMYRGFENILVGHDPTDAVQICQRI